MERARKRMREWVAKNPDRKRESDRAYRKNNRGKCNSYSSLYRAARTKATPSWLTPEHHAEMRSLYNKSTRLTRQTGEPHAVDHIVPLVNELVCGLHVPWNLQVITRLENLQKKNKLL